MTAVMPGRGGRWCCHGEGLHRRPLPRTAELGAPSPLPNRLSTRLGMRLYHLAARPASDFGGDEAWPHTQLRPSIWGLSRCVFVPVPSVRGHGDGSWGQ